MPNQSPTFVSKLPHGTGNPGYVPERNEIESGDENYDMTNGTRVKCNDNGSNRGKYPGQGCETPRGIRLPHRHAISVEAGKKSYGKFKVLMGINMHVQEGSIYGLLGSSGCGKTTLLSCMVGLSSLDSGKILICGKEPNSPGCGVPGRLVGYMPQEIALNGEFTIREVCHCFGRLYGMTKMRVDNRVDKLVDLLDMKRCIKTYIKNLSGGQKRRASFLVALLHEPEILVLDEPTVGVDPVLRTNIWNHLRDLVKNFGTTVLITTHYIEEMRQADMVGIMRGGILMAEDTPPDLLEQHNVLMLEEVVLQYCMKDDDPFGDENRENHVKRSTSRVVEMDTINLGTHSQKYGNGIGSSGSSVGYPVAPYWDTNASEGEQTHSINRIRALVNKNLIVMYRNLAFLLFVFMTPAIVTVLFCYAIGSSPKNLGLGIVNEGTGRDCKPIGAHEFVCSSQKLDCAFIDTMQLIPEFELFFYNSIEDALQAVDKKIVWGYLHFGSNFSEHIYDRTLGIKNTNDTIYSSRITIRLDMTTITTTQIIQTKVFEVYRIFSTKLLTTCKIDITGRDLPIHIGEPIYGKPDLPFTAYIAPGVSTVFISFMSSLTCGLALILEKKDGMIQRTKVAGVTTFEIMMSHFIPQFGVILIQTINVFVILFIAYDIPRLGSPVLAFAASAWYSVAGMCLGFLGSTIFDEEKNAMLLAIAFILPTFIVAGVLWPTETLPSILNKIGFLFPGGEAAESIRSILLRGWGLDNFFVYMGFISTLIFIVVYAAIAFAVLKLRK